MPIRTTGEKEKKIRTIGPKENKVDPAEFAQAIGADYVGPAPESDGHENYSAYKLLTADKVSQDKKGVVKSNLSQVNEKEEELVKK